MHEYGIAENILKTALAEAEKHQAKQIFTIYVQLGQMNFLTTDVLQSAFEIVARDTIAEKAKIVVEEIPGTEIKLANLDID